MWPDEWSAWVSPEPSIGVQEPGFAPVVSAGSRAVRNGVAARESGERQIASSQARKPDMALTYAAPDEKL